MCLKIYDRRGEITDNFQYLYYCLVLHPLQVLDFDDFDEASLFSRLQVFSILSIFQTLMNVKISRQTTVYSFVSIYRLRSSVTVTMDTN